MKKLFAAMLAACIILSSLFTVAMAEEEPIVIRYMAEDTGVWFPEGEGIGDNILVDFAEEQLGVEFEVMFTADNGTYAENINLMIAANDLPDMFYAQSGQMQTLYEYGMIQPIGQFFDEYVAAEALEQIAWNGNVFYIGATFDGEVYGFPCTNDFMEVMPLLWVRQDWLDNLGLEYDINNFTMDDFLEMCEAFTNGDPDGNGVNDTWGFDFHGNSVDHIHMSALAHAMGLQYNMWNEDENGQLYYTGTTEEMKPLLALLQDMYKKGYIPQDFVATDYWVEGTADLAANKVGIFPGFFWSGLGAPQTASKALPEAKWTVFPAPQNPEGGYSIQSDVTCFKYLVVNSNFEHPEKAVEYMQLWYDLWRGVHSEFYHGTNATEKYIAAQEDFKIYPPFWWDPPLKNNWISNKIVRYLASGDETEIFQDKEGYKMVGPINDYLAGNTESPDYWYGFAQAHNFIQAQQVVETVYGGTNPDAYIMNLAESIPVDQDMAGVKSLLDDLYKEYYNKIIMGADLDSTFAEYCEQWVVTGGEDLAEYYNEWYAEYKAK